MEIELGISAERVDKFCYLGEMLGEEGGAELAVAGHGVSLTLWRLCCAIKVYRGG